MFRLVMIILSILIVGLSVPTKAGTLAKVDDLERRLEGFDRRMVAIEAKIELLLDYLKSGQGVVNRSMQPVQQHPMQQQPMMQLQQQPMQQPQMTAPPPPLNPQAFGTNRRRVITNNTDIHQHPTATSNVIARVNSGTWLEVQDRSENRGWYQVYLPGGMTGFVSERDIQ